jgi:hypothetical protein
MTKDQKAVLQALDALQSGGFALGPRWEEAHGIAQAHEGKPLFDWIHALCHRIEGDDWNAGYWYSKAAKPVSDGSFAEECDAIRRAIN